jgi:hypothetical protein
MAHESVPWCLVKRFNVPIDDSVFARPSSMAGSGGAMSGKDSTKAREATHTVDQDLAAIDVAGRVFSSSSAMDLTLAIVAKRLRSAYSVRSRIASTPNSSPGLS